jgi:DNA helicase-2/ATP-dependent DNA helicase PcrA
VSDKNPRMTEGGFRPRPGQQEILSYSGGRMGVSAVPGAGKTHILSVLAAQLVASSIDDDQEVLIVTLMNSAVENIKGRVAGFVGGRGLLANVGYRVRTLHGLSHDIVRERPGLVGLAEDFSIVDERTAQQVREDVVEVWLRSHPGAADLFLSVELADNQREWAINKQWPDAVLNLASVFIKRAKDLRLSPEELLERLAEREDSPRLSATGPLRLARMGAEMYADYQKALYYRGGVDFDDLIRLALLALELDEDLLDRLRHRWPFILEDEAQDSSLLQETILDQLAGPNQNWVRVGDPNQAINTTFTTADPRYLNRFLERPDVRALPMDSSGRSQQCILDLANALVQWTMNDHPERRVRDALRGPPYIRPTPPGDPQPNPPADPAALHLYDRRLSPDKEIETVVQSLVRWLPEHPEDTVAVLVPRNQRGFEVTDALRRAGIEPVELLRSTTSTRKAAGALGNVLNALGHPSSSSLLARAFEVWRRDDREEQSSAARLKRLSTLIRRHRRVETYLWPRAGHDWLQEIQWQPDELHPQEEPEPEAWVDDVGEAQEAADQDDGDELAFQRTQFVRRMQSIRAGAPAALADREMLEAFRALVQRWQEATLLPVDQLVLTITQDLFIEPADLALGHKLAVMLRSASDDHPEWRLPELSAELAVIARNQRRFLGFQDEDTGYEPQPGEVTVSTLHKAKGLEWDRVYVLSVNNYDFPSAQPYDEYIGERWFIRDRLNLEAEALAQLEALVDGTLYGEGVATRQARLDYVRERLRLLYVSITRARKELILTWNTGRSREAKQMAVPFIALQTWWEEQRAGQWPGHPVLP